MVKIPTIEPSCLPGADVLMPLRASLKKQNSTLIGAAIGTGMAAMAAIRGGADFLLALNAGRLRAMGVPSILSHLALKDNNSFVLEFARSEILPRSSVPVFFGASCFDPRMEERALLANIKSAGFAGIVNFPTSTFFNEITRSKLDDMGVGFIREVSLLRSARRHGLATLAYVHTLGEAEAMAKIGVDIINVNFGWNVGGTTGVKASIGLLEAAEYAKVIFQHIREIHPTVICMVEGGPIVNSDEMFGVCHTAKSDGYIGGSTIDRLPLEYSIEQVTSSFKAVGMLTQRVAELERKLDRVQRHHGFIGRSAEIRNAQKFMDRIAASDLPILIVGEKGTGKKLLANSIHNARGTRRGKFLVVPAGPDIELQLFGCMPGVVEGNAKARIGHLEANPDSTIFVQDIAKVPRQVQEHVLNLLEMGTFRRIGGQHPITFSGRIVFSAYRPLEELQLSGAIDDRLGVLLGRASISLPPLRERMEDIPMLCESFLRDIQKSIAPKVVSVDQPAYRKLFAYSWPGNVRELKSTLEQAALRCTGSLIGVEQLPILRTIEKIAAAPGDERAWIQDALRRNRYRKAETARHLGISRKSLYNKMKKLGLPMRRRRKD